MWLNFAKMENNVREPPPFASQWTCSRKAWKTARPSSSSSSSSESRELGPGCALVPSVQSSVAGGGITGGGAGTFGGGLSLAKSLSSTTALAADGLSKCTSATSGNASTGAAENRGGAPGADPGGGIPTVAESE